MREDVELKLTAGEMAIDRIKMEEGIAITRRYESY